MELILMILLLSVLSAADDPKLQNCSVTAEEGENVILPVKVDLPENSELSKPTIKWKTETDKVVHQYRTNTDYNVDQIERFKGRTSLFKQEFKKGNVSLKISNITKNDEGNYTCEILHNNPDLHKTYHVFLWVTEIRGPKGIEGTNPKQTDPKLVIALAVIGGLITLVGVTIFSYKKCKGPKLNTDQTAPDVNPMMDNGEGDLRDGGDSVSLSEGNKPETEAPEEE